MKILFWGTPAFAVPSLRALDDEGFDVVGVVTQPDRPAGRGRKLRPSPVKELALELGIPLLQPERPRGEEFLAQIAELAPDVSVVVAYGNLLPQDVLDAPPMGSFNIHASLLPELRGAAPINWAIARGHHETGITIQRMVLKMDAGPIVHRVPEPILDDETAAELTLRLSELGAAAIVEALALVSAGVPEVEQDHDAATFAPKVGRDVARIDWSRPAREIACHVRGMDAVPGAWTQLGEQSVKLFRPRALPEDVVDDNGLALARPGEGRPVPGTVLATDPEEGVLVTAGDGAVLFSEAQPPGKRRMDVRDWINGRGIERGQTFR